MAQTDLRRYVIHKAGTWTESQHLATNYRRETLVLSSVGDFVNLAGPLRLRITFFAKNVTHMAGGVNQEHESELYSYILNIPAGHQWSYTLQDFTQITSHFGANAGYSVRIEEAGAEAVATVDPDADVPCGFATQSIADVGKFFPAPCEGCPPGTPVHQPPGCSPTLVIPPAPGGCLRPRFFNGMFITREDLETFVRWSRLKDQLHNRASGDGVVWGLGVCRDANAVLVQPGYAVDCCGHDLTVTAPYRVAGDLLLCDPAAREILSQQGAQCLHLLLEYVECPEEPRPVHGDPCTPQSSHCEMSRIRETVRLRLVPPRHYQPRGPITDFVNEISKELKEAGIDTSAGSYPKAETPPAAVPNPLPFTFELTPPAAGRLYSIQPRLGQREEVSFPDQTPREPEPTFQLRLRAQAGWQFLAGEVGNGQVRARVTSPSPSVEWPIKASELTPGGSFTLSATFAANNLELAPVTSGVQLRGSLLVTMIWVPINPVHPSLMTLIADRVQFTAVQQPTPIPCTTDPCCSQRPLFPVPFPWLNEHPRKPGKAADPEVLGLAVLYAWMALEQSRRQAASPDVQTTYSQQSLQGYAVSLARKIFGDPTSGDVRKLADALQRLLCAWCRGFLYPGPRCEGEPHGVVIGCVRVEGGRIASVDPWGGRRYVVHYPLLSHWGSQVGLAPLDLTVSRVMAMVCCIAGLPAPSSTGVIVGFDAYRDRAKVLPVGHSYLVIDEDERTPATAAGRADAMAELVYRSEDLPLLDFVNRAASVLGEEPPANASTRFVRYRSASLPGVSLLVPEAAPAAPAASAAQPQRLARKIEELAASTKTAVPPLLERLTRELTTDVLRVTAIPGLSESPLRDRLAAAGVHTAADLLSHDLAELHETLEGTDARGLLALAAEAERAAAEVSLGVRGVIQKFSAERDAVAPEELATADRRAELAAAVAAEVKRRRSLAVSPEVVSRLVESTLGRIKVRPPAATAPTGGKPARPSTARRKPAAKAG